MDFQRALVIMNPVAGQHNPAETRTLIEQRFADTQQGYELRETREAGDALRWAQQAAKDGFDLVVVSGGDGTIMEAMSGLIKGGGTVPLAQLPRAPPTCSRGPLASRPIRPRRWKPSGVASPSGWMLAISRARITTSPWWPAPATTPA